MQHERRAEGDVFNLGRGIRAPLKRKQLFFNETKTLHTYRQKIRVANKKKESNRIIIILYSLPLCACVSDLFSCLRCEMKGGRYTVICIFIYLHLYLHYLCAFLNRMIYGKLGINRLERSPASIFTNALILKHVRSMPPPLYLCRFSCPRRPCFLICL